MKETIEYKGYTIEINQDENPWNPREWDNLGTMVCAHSRYSLGDIQVRSRDEFEYHVPTSDKIISLGLYLYDHGGIIMRTSPFYDPWDSGQVGVIFVTLEKVREEYGWTRITKERRERIVRYLQGEVETYDDYLTGAVYGYTVKDQDGNEIDDTCWGFHGYNHEKSGLMSEARGTIDWEIQSMITEAQEENKQRETLSVFGYGKNRIDLSEHFDQPHNRHPQGG